MPQRGTGLGERALSSRRRVPSFFIRRLFGDIEWQDQCSKIFQNRCRQQMKASQDFLFLRVTEAERLAMAKSKRHHEFTRAFRELLLTARTRQIERSACCPYFIDAICIGSLWCGDRTLPRAMPTKNIAANITAITPSFRGGPSLRVCLSIGGANPLLNGGLAINSN
jgi:hypothetical protein